jgi:hypothetical protein
MSETDEEGSGWGVGMLTDLLPDFGGDDDDNAPEISQDDAQAAIDGQDLIGRAKDHAETVAKSALINNLPGAGSLFSHDLDAGFSFTPLGRNILLAAAAFGAWRMLNGRR